MGSAALFSANNSPSGVAADSSGEIFASGFEAPVQRFSPAGASLGTFTTVTPRQIAIDPTDDHVYLTRTNATTGEWEVAEYAPDGTLVDEHAVGIPAPAGLAVNATTGRIYVSDSEGGRVIAIDEVASQPLPTVSAATSVTADGAVLNGSVNPNGSAYNTRWNFICTPACPNVTGGDAGNGSGEVPVSTTATGLDPNTTYHVRLVATREFGAGSAVSGEITFTTAATAPTLSLVAASRVTDTSADLGALIDPQHSPTTYRFEYGTDTSYGRSAPAVGGGDAGNGLGLVSVAQTITGLAPSTTYHFKVIAENSAGAMESQDVTFATRPAAEALLPLRGIELVNPPDKSNQNPYGYLTPNGQSVAWALYTGGPNAPIGQAASFLASRTPGEWRSTSLVPPAAAQVGNGELPYALIGANDDYSERIFQVGQSPNDGGEEPPATIVRIDRNGNQTSLHTFASANEFWIGSTTVADGVNRVFLLTSARLDPTHPEGVREVYDFGADPPVLISRLPGTGAAATCGVRGDEFRNDFGGDNRWTSTDGSLVYFSTRGDDCGGPIKLYLFDSKGTAATADDTTTAIAPAPVAGPDEDQILLEVSPGGGVVFYSSAQLTADDANAGKDVYRRFPGGGPNA